MKAGKKGYQMCAFKLRVRTCVFPPGFQLTARRESRRKEWGTYQPDACSLPRSWEKCSGSDSLFSVLSNRYRVAFCTLSFILLASPQLHISLLLTKVTGEAATAPAIL